MSKRVCFISILGVPGTYDPAIYDFMPGGDDDAEWFRSRFGNDGPWQITGVRLALGEPLPEPGAADVFVLGGSYHSVYDGHGFQAPLDGWLKEFRRTAKPLFGICGGHQAMCHALGRRIGKVTDGPLAKTCEVELTDAGATHFLFEGAGRPPRYHFANFEHVEEAPAGATILARHPQVPVAALDYGDGWYSCQFHPEETANCLAASWEPSRPGARHDYTPDHDGRAMVLNFLRRFAA